ncbi:MerR family transcriptional regulator (plasmid) [Paracoccus liaowanqingii]|uniref:MerR family transcriptional regulator n=1 Tax=Paracoccus liaowanqingii TaxID=2560053 RepID=A0A4Y5SSM4_9RHOB|nr:MerR family transcriptional regulator [Paracoccus liaowanqingii]QDA36510.1 MerR family transcriptional regulator [Paracoccus liaowanqingii]
MQGHSIGALSKRTGVKVTTIRFYEGRGLLPDPGRTGGGQRRYGDAELDRLSFIAHARQLGFDLDAIADLIALQETPRTAHGDAHRIATDRISDIRGRIERLRRLERELVRVVNACDGRSDGHPCRVLHALADHQACDGEH